MTAAEYLRQLCYRSLEKRGLAEDPVYQERLAAELDILHTLNFEEYFLIVADIVHWCRKNHILTGPGRGSAAGSLISYLLGITHLDPVKYGLLFERFLNPGRGGEPKLDFPAYPLAQFQQEHADYELTKPFMDMVEQHADPSRKQACPQWENEAARIGYLPHLAAYMAYLMDQGIQSANPCHSALAYVVGITNERPTEEITIVGGAAPDIDLDVPRGARQDVIHYIIGKYGADRTSMIINYMFAKSKQAIRSAGQVLKADFGEIDKIARNFPETCDSIEEALETNPHFARFKQTHPEVIRTAIGIEGTINAMGMHAAGVLITPEDTIKFVPVNSAKDKSGQRVPIAAWNKDIVEAIGLLKMDILGIKNLDIIQRTMTLATRAGKASHIDPYAIPLDDPEVYDMICAGQTVGVFQLNGSGMTRFLRQLKPRNLDDLALANALFRPGPLDSGMTEQFLQVRNGIRNAEFENDVIRKILEPTNGVFVYQEQVMEMFRQIGGYSLAEADTVRKAMGKKKVDIMAKEKVRLTQRAQQRGYTAAFAEHMFNQVETFAGYGFNASHAYSYAFLGYVTAWFKVHYPLEFHAALLDYCDSNEELALTLAAIQDEGRVKLLPPDIVSSEAHTLPDEEHHAVRLGLTLVKGVSSKSVHNLLALVHHEKVRSIEDILVRMHQYHIRANDLAMLAKAGAMDSLIPNRRALVESMSNKEFRTKLKKKVEAEEKIKARTERKKEEYAKRTMDFEERYQEEIPTWPDTELARRQREYDNKVRKFLKEYPTVEAFIKADKTLQQWEQDLAYTIALPEMNDYPPEERMLAEYQAYGLFVSGHPLEKYRKLFMALHSFYPDELKTLRPGTIVKMIVIPTAFQSKISKNNNPYGLMEAITFGGTLEIRVWQDRMKLAQELAERQEPIVIDMKVLQNSERQSYVFLNGVPADDIPMQNIRPTCAFLACKPHEITPNMIVGLPSDSNGVPLMLVVKVGDNCIWIRTNRTVAPNTPGLRYSMSA